MKEYAEAHFGEDVHEYVPRFLEFPHLPEAVHQWVREEFPKRDRPKGLILWGPTRTGKTAWARSLGTHAYMNGMWNVEDFDDKAEYAVFDDMSLGGFTYSYKGFFGKQHITLAFHLSY